MSTEVWLRLGYLSAAILFIVALKLMKSPKTARFGNGLSMLGMAIAIGATCLIVENFTWIVPAVLVGSVIGVVSARRVPMTAMPQMVALFNGLGGGAVALVAVLEVLRPQPVGELGVTIPVVTTVLSASIGTISFAGSLIAFGKLQEILTSKALVIPGQKVWSTLLSLAMAALVAVLIAGGLDGSIDPSLTYALIAVSALVGVVLVLPIGGADMPVVISLLNSFTGVAAGLAGLVLDNDALLVGGALVGASGLILTVVMCSAMNRSLANVIFGAFVAGPASSGSDASVRGPVKSYGVEDAAILFSSADSVVIVPGYGMAVAQAQHVVKELADKLARMGIDVKFAIHPVAGRMPGHMNVLLAEADVPYDLLYDIDQINSRFSEVDVSLVIGANDVVNPAARTDKTSPIYGMPILDVDKSRHVIVLKRSMNPGYAGVENELFYRPNTVMVFGDAKKTVSALIAELDKYA